MAPSASAEIPGRGKYLDRIKDQPLKELLAALRMPPSVSPATPSQAWLHAQEQQIHKLGGAVSHAGVPDRLRSHIAGGAALCPSHGLLNGRAVRALVALVSDECGMHADELRGWGPRVGRYGPAVEGWLGRMSALGRNFASSSPGAAAAEEEDGGGRRLVVESGCEACICALVGGRRELVMDLLASLWSRKGIGGIEGIGRGTEGRPRLERAVVMWMMEDLADEREVEERGLCERRVMERGMKVAGLASLIGSARGAMEVRMQQQEISRSLTRLEEMERGERATSTSTASSSRSQGGSTLSRTSRLSEYGEHNGIVETQSGYIPRGRNPSRGSTNIQARNDRDAHQSQSHTHKDPSPHDGRPGTSSKPLPPLPQITVTDFDASCAVRPLSLRSTAAKGKEEERSSSATRQRPQPRAEDHRTLRRQRSESFSSITRSKVTTVSGTTLHYLEQEDEIQNPVETRRRSSSTSTVVTTKPALQRQARDSGESIQSFSAMVGKGTELPDGGMAYTYNATGGKNGADVRAWFNRGVMDAWMGRGWAGEQK